jgi:hypothetical protein
MGEHKEIPIDGCPHRYIEIDFKGWTKIKISHADPAFNEAMSLASAAIKNVYDLYKDTHAFSKPIFGYSTDAYFYVRIGLMKLERYNEIYNNEDR